MSERDNAVFQIRSYIFVVGGLERFFKLARTRGIGYYFKHRMSFAHCASQTLGGEEPEMLIDHKHLCLAMEVIGRSQLQRACCDAQASVLEQE